MAAATTATPVKMHIFTESAKLSWQTSLCFKITTIQYKSRFREIQIYFQKIFTKKNPAQPNGRAGKIILHTRLARNPQKREA